jgi:hypothetical protein
MTPSPEETRHLRLLAESGAAILAGVTRELPGWVERQVSAILGAWGRADAATRVQIVRSAYREPTAVLEAAGIPPVERSEFDERAWPDDRYGLVIHDLGALGDEELAPLHFAWGVAKAGVLRARADAPVTDL